MLLLTFLLACGGGGTSGVHVPKEQAAAVETFRAARAGKEVWSVRYVRRQLSFNGQKLPWDGTAENDATLPALVVTANKVKKGEPEALVSLGGGVSFFDTTRIVSSLLKGGAKSVYLHSAETNEILGPLVSPVKEPGAAPAGAHKVVGGTTDLRIEVHASAGDHWAVAAASFTPKVEPGPGLPATVGGASAETPTDAAAVQGTASTFSVDCAAISGGDAALQAACEQAPAGSTNIAVLGCVTPPVAIASAVDEWRVAGTNTIRTAGGKDALRQTVLLMEDRVPLVAWWELWAATEGKAVIGGGLQPSEGGHAAVCPPSISDPAAVALVRAKFLGGLDGGPAAPAVDGSAPAEAAAPVETP